MPRDPVIDFLERMGTGGWSGLDGLGNGAGVAGGNAAGGSDALLRLLEEQEALVVGRVLDTEDGRTFLDLLAKKTVLLPPLEEERAAQSAEAFALIMARRDGRNRLFFTLLEMLRRYHGLPKPQQPGGHT